MCIAMRRVIFSVLLLVVIGVNAVGTAYAETLVKLLDTAEGKSRISLDKITAIVNHAFKINQFREIRVQVINDNRHQPGHLLVFLFRKGVHGVEVARVDLDSGFNASSVRKNYLLDAEDFAQQPGLMPYKAECPDTSTEFIAFAPNNDSLEQSITIDVARAAEAHSLRTVRLLQQSATRTNYLNYMKCPRLKGNFYDGDANTQLITTVDGVISYADINSLLYQQFNYKVTNIWLACRAFNDPMRSSLLVSAQSQKYAAGINDLKVGPSDRAANCAMKEAISGKPMASSFQDCIKRYSSRDDRWGFAGNGADIFGV